jgi:hypothetical protein
MIQGRRPCASSGLADNPTVEPLERRVHPPEVCRMSYLDVAIPLVGGLLLVLCPGIFLKKAGTEADFAKKVGRIRKIGYVLVGVAGLYLLIKLAGH